MAELGLGVSAPEFVRAFGLIAAPICIGIILMIWTLMRPHNG